MGVYLGTERDSNEYRIAGRFGAVKAATVKRSPSSHQWQKELVLGVTGVPWKPYAGGEGAARQAGADTSGSIPSTAAMPTRDDGDEGGAGDDQVEVEEVVAGLRSPEGRRAQMRGISI